MAVVRSACVSGTFAATFAGHNRSATAIRPAPSNPMTSAQASAPSSSGRSRVPGPVGPSGLTIVEWARPPGVSESGTVTVTNIGTTLSRTTSARETCAVRENAR